MTALDQYKAKAVWLIQHLIEDFKLNDFQCAAICGNAYQESMLQAALESDGIVTSPTRGIGWFQWTGQRHRAFIAWCTGAKIDWRSDDAEYGFLRHELRTDYAHVVVNLRAATTLAAATESFEKYYEAAAIVDMGHRITGAEIALAAWRHPEATAA